jgi:hypothetical protein
MQDVQRPGQADMPRATVAEGLHPAGGQADRVRVVPVRRERVGGQVHLGALEARGAGAETDRVRAGAAGSFKTAAGRALYGQAHD